MITPDLFLESIQSIFDETPKEQILLNTKFKELDEWDSLLILGLIVFVEDNYSYLLTATQIEKANTLNDILILINHKNVV